MQDPLVGRVVDGRYAVRSRIARGGMATVYLATDTRLDRDVALKVMHPHLADDEQFVARFHREAKSAASLSHPNVVAVFDQGAQGDTVYLAMEHLPGETLRDLLASSGPLTPREALAVLEPVLDALGTAHHAGLIHRDVKPENVLIGDDGRVKVADFGLARAASGSASGTTQGMLIGTVAYLSPELVLRGVADARSDVYAAGVMLFELLTGRQPFTGEVPIQVAYQHVNSDVPPPSALVPGLDPALDRLVQRATARDADDRPADARDLLAEVRDVRRSLSDEVLDLQTAGHAEPASVGAGTLAIPRHEHVEPLSVGPADEGGDAAATSGDTREQEWSRPARRRRPILLALLALLVATAVGVAAWWTTAGPGAYTTTPAVVGSTLAEAERALVAAGLEADVGEQYDDEAPEGQVIDTDPAPGAQIREGGTVEVVVSSGPEFVAVPEVAGTPLEDARAALEELGLTLGEVSEAFSETVEQGAVVSQSVVPGEEIRRSQPVDLVVSKGREPIPVPAVTELPRADAEAALTEAGLEVGEVTSEPSETVAEGTVISQAPPDGTLFRGDPVALVVSSGPPLVTIPPVQGLQVDDAIAELEAVGLVPEVERVLGGIFGTVHSTEPVEGEQVRKGSTVTVRVV